MDLLLKGRKALVTGGSKGIGRRIADLLAEEGVDVAVCGRNADDVSSAVAALGAKGVRASGRALDVGDGAALKAWVTDVGNELGGLDIVVPNVSALAIGHAEEQWNAQYQIDLLHTIRTVEAAMPFLEQSDAGSIVAIATVSGRELDFAAGAYGALKAALIHYIQGLALSLAPKGIRANTVSPGNIFFAGGPWDNIKKNIPDLYNAALALNPTGRMGKPEEIAYAAVMLASPRASFITGTNLVADGALTKGVQF
jgi:NAD(P)-dependent dehydrogenase (short-subunit alcohol dehydrogenase family)